MLLIPDNGNTARAFFAFENREKVLELFDGATKEEKVKLRRMLRDVNVISR